MKITRITDANVSYFKAVIPDRYYAKANTVLGAIDDEGRACGVLLADIGSTEAELLWLFVDENHRGMGCGEELLSTFTGIADAVGVRVSFFTLIESKSVEEFIDFLESKTGFVRELDNRGTLLSFRLDSIKGSANSTEAAGIKPLSSALPREEEKIKVLLKQNFGVSAAKADMDEWKSSNLSFVKVMDNEVISFILVRFVEDDGAYEKIMVDYIYSSTQGIKPFISLIKSVRNKTKELDLPANTRVQAVAINNTISGLINELTDSELTEEGTLTVWTRRN